MRHAILAGALWAAAILGAAAEPQSIALWPTGAMPGPRAKPVAETVRLTERGEHVISGVREPSITPYLPPPDRASGAAVIVIPGGGHRELWMDHEGYRVGQWLADHGIAAFVLKYRLAKEVGSPYTVEGDELADAQRAERIVRYRATEWHVSPSRIGVLGFSAGGELAALAGTRPFQGTPGSDDPIARTDARADFMILVYPGLSQQPAVAKDVPPTFLLCGANDSSAIVSGTIALDQAIAQAGGSAELHILAGVGHGFGIRADNPASVALWPTLVYDWLDGRGLLKSP